MHPTFLILIALALLGGLGPPISGLLTLVLLFGSVLVHELAHSLVAKRKGVVVRDIVLLPIGGASEMEMKPEKPVDELVIAIVGPLTSAVLSAGAFGVLLVTGRPVGPAFATGGLLVRLAWANAMLRAVWPNYTSVRGVKVVLPLVVADAADLADLKATAPASRYVVCELTAPRQVLEERVTRREPNEFWTAALLKWIDVYHRRDDLEWLRDFHVSTHDKPVDLSAEEVISLCGWGDDRT